MSLGIPFNPAARVTVSYEHKWTWNSGTTEMIRSGTDPNATYWYWGDLLTNQVGTPSPSDGAFFSGGRGLAVLGLRRYDLCSQLSGKDRADRCPRGTSSLKHPCGSRDCR